MKHFNCGVKMNFELLENSDRIEVKGRIIIPELIFSIIAGDFFFFILSFVDIFNVQPFSIEKLTQPVVNANPLKR